MSALGWITTGHRLLVASFLRRRTPRKVKVKARASVPGFESLETIDLLSHVLPLSHTASKPVKAPAAIVAPVHYTPPATGEVLPFTSKTVTTNATPMATTQRTALQTVTVPDTLTNFSQPFTPPIALFNPALGQLVSVRVTSQATLMSNITSENTSTTSGADITGFTNGTLAITGLIKPITATLSGTTETVTVPPFSGGVPDFTGPSTVVFPPLTVTTSQPEITYTSPSDLAFFTASAGRTTLSPVLSANANSGANAPNGNLLTLVRTSGSGLITVTYEYTAACPPITNLVRFGIHHQPTQIQLTFGGPLDPAQASNPAYYTIVVPNAHGSFTGKGTTTIPVTSAVYNATNHTVTLTTAKRLNVHHLYELVVNLPCADGNPTVIEFGSKMSLGGFKAHNGTFIPVVGGVAYYPKGPGPLPPGR